MTQVTNSQELTQALNAQEPEINIIGHLQLDRPIEEVTWPLKIQVGEGCQLDTVTGEIYCRTDLGTSVCGLNQVEIG